MNRLQGADALRPLELFRPRAAARPRTSVLVLRDAAMLSSWIEPWEELAANALEPNVFYEPWMLLPALAAFGKGVRLRFVLILQHDRRRPDAPPRLVGLFPLQRMPGFKRIPLSTLRLWRHRHCFLCTPLVHAEAAADGIGGLLRWLASDPDGAAFLNLEHVAGDGPFARALAETASQFGMPSWLADRHERATLRAADPAWPLPAALDRKRREAEKRLAREGRFEYVALPPDGDVDRWIEDFLRLEASGWKGRQGSALACCHEGREFFTATARAAFERGRFEAFGLDLEGQPIARLCAFGGVEARFGFKMAYDERYKRCTPGILMQFGQMRRLAAQARRGWFDSCTAPDNQISNRLWPGRRAIDNLVIGTRLEGRALVAAMPLLRLAFRWGVRLGARITARR